LKKLIVVLVLALAVALAAVSPALAHVHGITPLRDCTVDNPLSGAIGTDGTPADDANGGPITGLIPRDTGEAPLTAGDGGFGAAAGHCP